ncbi:hypothetical protein J3D55_001580 [Chryseobacterium ginsenosidimutans]|uniref:hypothetical protein n=1 Tax=Chryseobacterium ginsenosidimutans TaxID=687846 RepID=UPI002168DBCE|nr:hypothetical protein [Chryseobacterium ginsenosidimutans]MCS3868664.1 hypothetical protein [Chryseobacterium ginsenosidimutans]
MKNLLLLAVLFSTAAHSQVGVNTANPQTSLDVVAKNATGNSTNVDGILLPRVDRERAQNMSAIPTSTLIYVNSIATGTATGNAVNIDNIGYYYFDGTVWVKFNDKVSNVSVQSFQLKIPPHGMSNADFSNHTNATFDFDNWWVISKTSVNPTTNVPARMTIVYEYQGTPFPDVQKIFPQLAAGNDSSFPDIFSPAFIKLANVGGKTRMTVSVTRADNLASQWGGTFLLNVLFSIKS